MVETLVLPIQPPADLGHVPQEPLEMARAGSGLLDPHPGDPQTDMTSGSHVSGQEQGPPGTSVQAWLMAGIWPRRPAVEGA